MTDKKTDKNSPTDWRSVDQRWVKG